MKKYCFLGYALLVWATTACTKDPINIADPNQISGVNFPQSVSDLNAQLNGCYNNQHSFGLYGHNMLGKNLYGWDHTMDNGYTQFPEWLRLTTNETQAGDNFPADTYGAIWRGIQRCNTLLTDLDRYRSGGLKKTGEDATLALMEGQARFLRAWFYYHALAIWGEDFIVDGQGGDKLGVQLIDKAATNLTQTYVARATVRESWDFIISDLKKAETLLANTASWSDDADQSRVTKWAVKSFLGKVYAFTSDWPNAKTYLQDVVTNGKFSLVPSSTYEKMFNGENGKQFEYTSENIYQINMEVDRSTWGAWGDNSTGSGVAMVISPSFMTNSGGSGASGWGNVFVHDRNLQRFGYTLPMVPIVDNPAFDPTIKDGEGKTIDGYVDARGKWNLSKVPDPAYLATARKLKASGQVDPRLWVATLQPYLDSMTVDGLRRPVMKSHELTADAPFYGWSFRKYVNLLGNEYSVNVNNGSNFYFLRLADIYLLYAEALAKGGDNAGALEYINKVHRRAYGFSPDGASPVDYASLSAPTKATDAVLGNNPLRYERWAELFGEGHWWFDVRRWKIGDREAAFYVRTRGGEISWQNTDYAQPIPRGELSNNPKARQNAGY